VLVVEDEAALGAAVAEALRRRGFEVHRAFRRPRGARAGRGAAFDLIICDLKMPRLDGPAFHRQLVGSHPMLARRVLFVTGDVAGTEAERFLEEIRLPLARQAVPLRDLLRGRASACLLV
jgi:DNA-binding response OmpR family regulator